MNGYNFTERVRKALQFAREEAQALHHEYVGTEHILLGIVREGEGVASAALDNIDVDREAIREAILQAVKRGPDDRQSTGPDLPYTSRAKKSLELAMSEARNRNHSYVGTEHLLMGLLMEEKGIAAQVLNQLGATATNVRAEYLRLLAGEMPHEKLPSRANAKERPVITVVVEHADGRVERKQFKNTGDATSFLTQLEL